MKSNAAPTLIDSAGNEAVLNGVKINMVVEDLVAETTVEQHYHNPTGTNIEAVYTFPLPVDAVLLSFEVELGEHKLKGRIVEKSDAETQYEHSIIEGNAAVLLEEVEPGMYTASLGNLLPGETAKIRFTHGMLLGWNGNQVRINIPTTIAPRFGQPKGLEPHQVPVYSFAADHKFSLRIAIRGILHDAALSSPTHSVRISDTANQKVIELPIGAPMDRDFILEANYDRAVPAGTIISRDIDGWVAISSFRPSLPAPAHQTPKSIKIVVDCSGSMNGDSIEQAKIALKLILESLRSGDFFDIVAFGSNQRAFFGAETPVGRSSVARAQEFVDDIGANMGGTEIGDALRAAYQLSGAGEISRDILLITDGEAWETDQIIAEAKKSGHRIFSVGVGSSVAEGLVRDLATHSGGASEFVSPRENMATRIHRHFQRIHSPQAANVTMHWPTLPLREIRSSDTTVYDGDTVHYFAWFDEKPTGASKLLIDLPNGLRVEQSSAIREWDEGNRGDFEKVTGSLPSMPARLAASAFLKRCDDDAVILARSLDYQLVSKLANYVIVHERSEEEKAIGLPETIKVKQTVAAGWHGMGSVESEVQPSYSGAVLFKRISRANLSENRYTSDRDAPDFLREPRELSGSRSEDFSLFRRAEGHARSRQISGLQRLLRFLKIQKRRNEITMPSPRDLLNIWINRDPIMDRIFALVAEGQNEDFVVAAFFRALARSALGKTVTREERRLLEHQASKFKVEETLVHEFKDLIDAMQLE